MALSTQLLRPIALAALFAVAGAAQATVTVHTTAASFAAATSAPGVDTFAGLSVTGTTLSPLNRTAGTYTYTVAAPNDFFGAGTTANPALSTNTATDTMTFSGFSSDVRGVGGNFFGSDISGLFAAADLILTITDASGTSTHSLIAPAQTSFFGLVSDSAITSFTLTSVQPAAGFLWSTVDNFTLAAAVTAVPEVSTYAMMLAGLAAMGFVARRRRV